MEMQIQQLDVTDDELNTRVTAIEMGGGSEAITDHNDLDGLTDIDAHPATSISLSTIAGMDAVDVQGAVQELKTTVDLKAPLDAPEFTGDVTTTGEIHGGTLKADNISPTQIVYATALGELTGSNDLTWDDSGKALAVGGSVAATGQITSANTAALKEPTGFESPELVSVAYDSTERKITLTQSGGIAYWWQGARYVLTSPWTSAAHDAGAGRYFLYLSASSTFTWAKNAPWTFDVAQIAVVVVNAITTMPAGCTWRR
jgi:hypothetical protein